MLGLIATTAFVYNYDPHKTKASIEEDIFAISEDQNLTEIAIQSGQTFNKLSRNARGWEINDKYRADQQLIEVLLAVLRDVRVKRPVASAQVTQVNEQMSALGSKVSVSSSNGLVKSFFVGGDPNQNTSYFKQPDQTPYVVTLPGYSSYVAGIFGLSEQDWRSRTVFNSEWTSIESVSLSYPSSPAQNFEIASDGRLFKVVDVVQLDTAQMMNYLESLSYFQVDNYLNEPPSDGELGVAFARLSLKDFNPSKSHQIEFFTDQKNGQNLIVRIDNAQWGTATKTTASQFFLRKEDFSREQIHPY